MYPAAKEIAQARATIYFALAESVAEPLSGIEGTLRHAAVIGAQVLDSEASRKAALALATTPTYSDGDLRKDYARAVSPAGRRPLALYESLHREGRLMGEATLDVKQCYRALGLASMHGELPDHASVELAFLGSLADTEAEARATHNTELAKQVRKEHHRFLHNHAAAWLPELGSALTAGSVPLYAVVGNWLNGFLQEEMVRHRRTGRRRGRWPQLRNAADCTLCGLCTGRCATGALRILEDAQETRLALVHSQCVGCDLCVAICPENVLSMTDATWSPELADGREPTVQPDPGQILRRSTRLACPRCGRPTVSKAELDGVFARLQLDAQMQQRMRLCVACKALF